MNILEFLKLPDVRNITDLDAPSTTLLHSKIIRKKPFLKKIYSEFYDIFNKSIDCDMKGKVFVELGSGGGFIKEVIPSVITSDVIDIPTVDKQFSALNMPFGENSVDRFFMIDVLHHISDPSIFFNELNRCLKVGGKIIMIEPANTMWGRFIYTNFHHEPFDPLAGWQLEGSGPLSSANGAIPWIIFYRDRNKFEKDFPTLKILKLEPHTPFRYLISGGVSLRQLLPSFTYKIVSGIERALRPLNGYLGMFLTIELEKLDNGDSAS